MSPRLERKSKDRVCPRLRRIVPFGMCPWLDRTSKDGVCSRLNRVIPSGVSTVRQEK